MPVFERLDLDGLVGVVLVGNIADDDFDQILDRDQAFGAAIFVDDDGQMRVAGLHAHQKIGGGHRGRHEQHLAVDARLLDAGRQFGWRRC